MFVCLFPTQNDQVLQGFSVDKGEFTCPLCRQFANSVLPCRPGRDVEAGAWHAPTNKKMCLLVKEVEELQERIGLFPVRLFTRLGVIQVVSGFLQQFIHCSRRLELFQYQNISLLNASVASVDVFHQFCFPPPFLIFQTETNLSKEMEFVTKDIKNTTKKKYRDYGKNPGSPDNDFLFMYSVAR